VVEAARKQKNIQNSHSDGVQKKALEPQLAEIFIRDAKKAITELEEVYLNKCGNDNDLSTFIITIHAMKSALANIGETTLSAEAAKLEQAGRDKNLKLVFSELPLFVETLHSIIEKLKPKDDDQNADDADNTGDNQYLVEKLLAVKSACELYYKKVAKDTLAEIRGKTWPQSVNEQLSAISVDLLHSDFDEAIQVIDSYVQQLKV